MLDNTDKTILSYLQQDSSLSVQKLADLVNLTVTPCWKRIKKLESLGIIDKRVTLLNPERLGLCFTAYVMIKTNEHSDHWYNQFVATVVEFPEVIEFYRMAGEHDYMMKVIVEDMKAFDRFYKKLVNKVQGLISVKSSFIMEPLKQTTVLPIK